MAYEKFIKKDGKTYGPYLYHSKRIDGKVVSEYQGQKKLQYSKFLWVIPLVLLIVAGAYLITHKQGNLTGNAVLNLNANYQEGKPLNGQLQFSLNQGELIPANSTVVFENAGQTYEYPLTELVSQPTTNGDFYIPGKSVSGSGDGFGIPGTKYVYPEVQFTLVISSPENSTTSTEAGTQTQVTTGNSEQSEINTTEQTTTDNTTQAESNTQTTTEESNSGNSSGGLLGVVSSFFLGLSPTGRVVAEVQNEIQGSASAGNPFTYTLQAGNTAEIKPKSVMSGSTQLSDDTVTLTTDGDLVSVSTNYSETQDGFGDGYTGGNTKDLSMNLDSLNLLLQKGELKVGIFYQGEELASLTTNLSSGGVSGVGEIPAQQNTSPVLNENSNITEENFTSSNNLPLISQSLQLTPEERSALVNQFGNISVQVKEAKSENGFITIRYELGDYWIENSYISTLDNATLSSFMEADRVKWLKDIAENLLHNSTQQTQLGQYLGNYSY